MADGVSFSMVTKPFTDFVTDRQTKMRQAAMFSLRETGRVVRKEGRARAPVYRGGDTVAQMRRGAKLRKSGASGPIQGQGSGPISGLLKASIAPSKQLKPTGLDSWALTVGPHGPRVHLYAAKIEQLYGYMNAARDAAQAQSLEIANKAYTKVWVG